MKIMLFFLLITASFFKIEAQQSGNENPFSQQEAFYFDILNFYSGDTANTKVDVFVQIPMDRLQFIKSGDNFKAEYIVSVAVFDENKLRVTTEKSWTEKITFTDFSLTNSKEAFSLTGRSFTLAPNKYYFRITIEDLDSRRTFESGAEFNVRTFDQKLALSDIMMISSRNVTDGKSKIVPNVSKNVANLTDGIPVFIELYLEEEGEITLKYNVTNSKNEILFSDESTNKYTKGNNQIFYTFKQDNIALGDFTMLISAKVPNEEVVIVSTKQFFSKWAGVPTTLKDLEKAVDQMIYIAGPSEISKINKGSDYSEKLKLFLEYWRAQDPTPNTAENEVFNEYYRRIAFANKHFKQMLEGWRTDMGMVYITLGAPSNIERHPFEYDSKPYEIWDYYDINRRFVFVDNTGFGDYRLITPFFGEYRYRY